MERKGSHPSEAIDRDTPVLSWSVPFFPKGCSSPEINHPRGLSHHLSHLLEGDFLRSLPHHRCTANSYFGASRQMYTGVDSYIRRIQRAVVFHNLEGIRGLRQGYRPVVKFAAPALPSPTAQILARMSNNLLSSALVCVCPFSTSPSDTYPNHH